MSPGYRSALNEVEAKRGRKRGGCRRFALGLVAALAPFAAAWSVVAQPIVSEVRASQRPGTHVVDVYYDLSGAETGGATVTLTLSDDAGASYGLPILSLSGDVGPGMANGRNRHVVWDAGADLADFASSSMRFRVRASVGSGGPAPEGFALIPAGTFQMGDSFDEGISNERPVHEVFVSAFYMGRTEVTWAQWREVRDWARDEGYSLGSGEGKGDDHPVHRVSWYDVVKWCNALSEREGLEPVYRLGDGGVYRSGESDPEIRYEANGYRLPSEAEWEKAARGGLEGRRFPWGDTISHERANYWADGGEAYDESEGAAYHPDYDSGDWPFTSPVGSFPANGYGLYDVSGNVWEWVNDWWDEDYYRRSPERDPRGPPLGSLRVRRGGSWGCSAWNCRSADRVRDAPSGRDGNLGFRVARSF